MGIRRHKNIILPYTPLYHCPLQKSERISLAGKWTVSDHYQSQSSDKKTEYQRLALLHCNQIWAVRETLKCEKPAEVIEEGKSKEECVDLVHNHFSVEHQLFSHKVKEFT